MSQDSMPEIIAAELEASLKKHDWYFAMSDDPGTHSRGQKQRDHINHLMKALPAKQAEDLWNQFSPFKK